MEKKRREEGWRSKEGFGVMHFRKNRVDKNENENDGQREAEEENRKLKRKEKKKKLKEKKFGEKIEKINEINSF